MNYGPEQLQSLDRNQLIEIIVEQAEEIRRLEHVSDLYDEKTRYWNPQYK